MRKKKLNESIKESLYDIISAQMESLIDIEIGNYAYEKGLELKCYTNYGNVEAWIKDDRFECEGFYEDMCHIVHLHNDDLLWAILNFNKIKENGIKYIDEYIKWRGGE